MVSHAINSHIKQAPTISLWVWFEGTTALLEGQGVCYSHNYGTATAADARRRNNVELPTVANADHFAGVAARAYAASSTGQFIEIYAPGSTCLILMYGPSTTVGTGLVTCQAYNALNSGDATNYAGYFTRTGFRGEGSAIPLQTVNASSAAATCLAYLEVGAPSGAPCSSAPFVPSIRTVFTLQLSHRCYSR